MFLVIKIYCWKVNYEKAKNNSTFEANYETVIAKTEKNVNSYLIAKQ